jgi:hypothetical protein
LIPHFHDGIVEQTDQGFESFRPADVCHTASSVSADGPEVVAACADQRLQSRGVAQVRKSLRCLLTGGIVHVFKRF